MITTESKKMGNLNAYFSEKKKQYVMNRPREKLKFAFKTSALLIITFVLLGSTSSAGPTPEEFVIFSNYNGTSIMLSFDEDGFFDLPDPVYPGNGTPCYGVGMADFDADGDFDFVLGCRFNGNIYYYEKTGPGNSFAAPVIVGTYLGYPLDFAVEDYNRDGNYDFIFTNFGGRAYLFEGRGDGTFTSRLFRVPSNCIAADSGDFNNDDIPDFALQSFGSGDALFFIYLGNGDGTFTESSFTGVFTTLSWGLTAGDFNGDGNTDILAGGGYYGTALYLYPGNGDGTFASGSHVVSLGPADNSPADNYDFNHDGFMDFACLKANERAVYVFFGDGTGSFMPAPENPIRVQTNATLYGIATPPHQNGWIVLAPQEAIEQLILQVIDLDLPHGIENSLVSKLDAAINSLDRGRENAAKNQLNAFINQVEDQRGSKISEEDADALIAAVQLVIDLLMAG